MEATGGMQRDAQVGCTTAQFHRAADLQRELDESGLVDVAVFGVDHLLGVGRNPR